MRPISIISRSSFSHCYIPKKRLYWYHLIHLLCLVKMWYLCIFYCTLKKKNVTSDYITLPCWEKLSLFCMWKEQRVSSICPETKILWAHLALPPSTKYAVGCSWHCQDRHSNPMAPPICVSGALRQYSKLITDGSSYPASPQSSHRSKSFHFPAPQLWELSWRADPSSSCPNCQ